MKLCRSPFPGKEETPVDFKVDEFPRLSSLETLATLPPAFKKGGTVTAGNSSGFNDGASFVLLMTAEKAAALGYKPLARWISGAEFGVDPGIMGIAPAYAFLVAVKRAGLTLADIDIIECNEAFAAQNLAVIREMEKQTGYKIDMNRWIPTAAPLPSGMQRRVGGRIGYAVHARAYSPGRALRQVRLLLWRRPGCGGAGGEFTAVKKETTCRKRRILPPQQKFIITRKEPSDD
jgi:hypothetical protein